MTPQPQTCLYRTTSAKPKRNRRDALGVSRTLLGEGLDEEVRAAIEKAIDAYRDLGAEIVDVELPHAKYAIAVYYIIATAEARQTSHATTACATVSRRRSCSVARHVSKTRDQGFGAEVKRRIMLGTYVLSAGYYDAYYLKAQKVRTMIKQDFATAFEKCDAVLTPTAPSPAFKFGERSIDPVAMCSNG